MAFMELTHAKPIFIKKNQHMLLLFDACVESHSQHIAASASRDLFLIENGSFPYNVKSSK